MKYEGTVYRPPSEAYSLIVQATVGCSQNECTFCAMYKEQKFRIRSVKEIKEDLLYGKNHYGNQVQRIFLADGDALVMKYDDLMEILLYIEKLFPRLDRVSFYASPASVMTKTPDQLKNLVTHGAKLAYLGIESGSDKVLKDIKKHATSQQIVKACNMLTDAGFDLSVTVIMGLGGINDSKEHINATAEVLNKINPTYLGLMTLLVKTGTEIYEQVQNKEFEELTPIEILFETKALIEKLELKNTIVRSNHVSNYAHIKGVLNKDKKSILNQIDAALKRHDFAYSKRIRDMYAVETGL